MLRKTACKVVAWTPAKYPRTKKSAATTSNWGQIENHYIGLYYWVCSTILSTFNFNLMRGCWEKLLAKLLAPLARSCKMPQTKKSRRQWGQRVGDNSQKTTDDSILPIEDNIELADDHDAEWAAFLDTLDNAKGIDQQTEKVAEGIRRLYPYEGRKEQVEAIRALIYDREDLILIAKTSFGKSMIPQAVSALRRNTITIMIIPLTALGEEQYHKMERLPGCKPCLLTAKTITKMVMRKIRNSEFTHILLSPELVNSPEFSNVTTDLIFKSRVGLVVVDELHIVKQ